MAVELRELDADVVEEPETSNLCVNFPNLQLNFDAASDLAC